MAEPGVAATFRKPFAEQIAAFRLRLGNQLPTSKWDDLWKAQHDRAFVVAGAAKADLLADLAGAVQKAIEQGTTLDEFRRDFRRIVEERGWHGWTGEGSAKGEAWRTKVIYRTNMRTSYMAGRWAQLQAGGFKYWVYRHGGSVEPRLQHLGWDGLILPADHPFWRTHFPPNGWGCSCYVIGARTMAAAIRRGGKPDLKLPPNWEALDPRTDEPTGIDRGWGYAPGASAAKAIQALVPKLEALPQPIASDLISANAAEHFAEWMRAPSGNWPIARVSDTDAERIASSARVAQLSPDTFQKQLVEHPELSAADYTAVQEVIDSATHVIKDGERSLVFIKDAPDGHLVVVKTTISGKALFLTSLRRMSHKAAQRDVLIRRILRREG